MCVCVCVTFYPNSTHIERERQREREREREVALLYFAHPSSLLLSRSCHSTITLIRVAFVLATGHCSCPISTISLSYLSLHSYVAILANLLRGERERERERELVQYFSPNNSFIGLKPKVALQVWRVTLMP